MGDYIVWRPNLTVHVEKIDDQHKELYRKMNDLVGAVMSGKGKDEIGSFTNFLADYTRFHFGDEEALMTKHAYPAYALQKSAHEEFTRRVEKMKAQVTGGEITSELVIKVIQELGDWLTDHISKMDKAMGEYVKTKL